MLTKVLSVIGEPDKRPGGAVARGEVGAPRGLGAQQGGQRVQGQAEEGQGAQQQSGAVHHSHRGGRVGLALQLERTNGRVIREKTVTVSPCSPLATMIANNWSSINKTKIEPCIQYFSSYLLVIQQGASRLRVHAVGRELGWGTGPRV